jgi:hypothetical protein
MEEEDEWETDPNFVVIISNFNWPAVVF